MSKQSSKQSVSSVGTFVSLARDDENFHTTPEFIYGGPFIAVKKPDPFLDTATPINLPLQGTFKKSFAYYSLKERLPIILTKIIDYISREGSNIKSANGANDEDLRHYIQFVTKLKNDLVTNKPYEPFTVDTLEAKKWNTWIADVDIPRYFQNVWLFSECYVYRKLREGCELQPKLRSFDPFEEQKKKSFRDNLELMCIVAEKVATMLPQSGKDKRKADFIALLKICLWSNKCDLSLSLGDSVSVTGKVESPGSVAAKGKGEAAAPAQPLVDPFQLIVDYKDKLLVDDTAKIADQVVTKAENMQKAIDGNTTFKYKCSCHRLATAAGMPICTEPPPALSPTASKGGSNKSSSPPPTTPAEPAEGEEPPKIPCPAKLTIPSAVMFDIVCDNAGYELFADLCLAHFLVSQKIVQKVRFHLKKYPWFVSDVTMKDFKFVISQCVSATYRREVHPEPKPESAEAPAEPEAPRIIASEALRELAEQWQQHVDNGVFVPMADDYWTYPHAYKDMKKYDLNMYRKLQYAVAILFKGDLNYRKLLADRNCNPVLGFEPSLQGFIPAPIIAARTIKSDLVCGLPKGKWEQLNKIDEKWMTTGDYGTIQFCPKAEPFKPSDKPCMDYGDSCFGTICPVHKDI